jgi:hypothetical protein
METERKHSERQQRNRELPPVSNESPGEFPKLSVHWTVHT